MADIDWTILARYAASDCTVEERLQVEHWLAAHPDGPSELHAIHEVAAIGSRTSSAGERAKVLAEVRKKVGVAAMDVGRGGVASHRPWRRMVAVVRVAAIIVGVIGGGVLAYAAWRSSDGPIREIAKESRTFTTPRAARLSLRLPDGTLVELAPASMLRLPADFGTRERIVELVGEAAFTATHDERRPFTVHTARLVARDLGTRFIVREYAEDIAAEVVVAEGVVAVTRDTSVSRAVSGSVILRAGEGVRTTADGQLAPMRDVSLERSFGWIQGRLIFRGTRLQDAITQLSRWYDVDVRLATPELASLPLSAVFEYTDPAPTVLQTIADGFDLRLVRDGRTYTLQTK